MSFSNRRRVVVTGMGLLTSLGSSVQDVWSSILSGQSGISRIRSFDTSSFSTKIAAEISNFSIEGFLSPRDARRMGLFMQYGVVSGISAFRDAGLDMTQVDGTRCGVCMGSGIGGLREIERASSQQIRTEARCSPLFVPMTITNMMSGHLSIILGFKGPNTAVATACATSSHAIGLAARHIMYGEADVMIAGGAEASLTPLGVGGFCSMRALSTRNDEPERASRPWDRDRDGFVLGEGAGALVLEEYTHAVQRNATIYCEIAGFAMNGDAYHMTAPCADGSSGAACMTLAVRDAGLNPTDIQYVNAHGTSTQLGDRAEVLAIHRAFGDHAQNLMVSSTKSMTGHLLGAAGVLEAALTALAVQSSVVPPTINLDHPEDDFGLDFVPHQARACAVSAALSNSFGFGGTNACLVIKKI